MRAKIKLWPQTRIVVSFLYTILCVITRTTWNERLHKDVLPIKWFALLLKVPILLVRAVCKIQSLSYGSKHTSQLCTYTHKSKSTACMWMFYRSSDCLLSEMSIFCVRAGCKIQIASYTPQTRIALSFISHSCVYSVRRCINWKLQVICGRSHIERLLYYWRRSLCGLELH